MLRMSGHSKWSTIKRQKGINDSRRGQAFTKIGNLITTAVKSGGGADDPEKNFKLRLAIEKARALNMPKSNIERAIERASGQKGGADWTESIFEGYGPLGIAVIVETATDNKNRTTAEVKNIFERGGGSVTSPGAVSFQFKQVGLITIKKTDDPEKQILNLMDVGVDDVEEATDVIEVYVVPESLREIRDKIEKEGFIVLNEELIMKPLNEVKIEEENKAQQILKFMGNLEDHDDVQKVYSNFDIPEEILKKISV